MAVVMGMLFVLVAAINAIEGAQITVVNGCSFTVWPGTLTGGGAAEGWQLDAGQSLSVRRDNGWTGRFWARTDCSFDGNGNGRCLTGDCNGFNCRGGGVPPATLAEFTLGGSGGKDFYDVSNVDGFNIPMSINPSRGGCPETSCRSWLRDNCPDELKLWGNGIVLGCKSACVAWNRPEDCCTGAHNQPSTCGPSQYSQFFKNNCPAAYSYAYDDLTSTFTCSDTDYTITLCP